MQTSIHHQQSEEGTRPLEDSPLAEEMKLHSMEGIAFRAREESEDGADGPVSYISPLKKIESTL